MITKGIIVGKSPTSENKYLVNLPALTNSQGTLSGFSKDDISEASVSSVSGIKNQLTDGDIVFVGFEDHDFRKPIILGILQTRNPIKNSLTPDITHNPDLSVRSLVVEDDQGASKAVLPQDTKIGNVEKESIQALSGLSGDNLERRLQYLQELIGSGGTGVDELSELHDVSINNIQNGQIIKYDSTTHKWVNSEETPGTGNEFIYQNENLIISIQTPGGYIINTNLGAELEDNVEGTSVQKQLSINSNTNISNGGTQFTISPITIEVGSSATISYTLTHYEYDSQEGLQPVVENIADTLTQVATNKYSYTKTSVYSSIPTSQSITANVTLTIAGDIYILQS